MPTYQYACTACGEQFEIVQKFTDDSLTACSACGGRLRKVFTPVGVLFKGSGFYRTDSRTKEKTAEPAKMADSTSATSSSGDSAASGDSSSSASSGDATSSANSPTSKPPAASSKKSESAA